MFAIDNPAGWKMIYERLNHFTDIVNKQNSIMGESRWVSACMQWATVVWRAAHRRDGFS